MKFAYLILAHHNPESLKRLILALDSPHFDFFVHIDARRDIEQFYFTHDALQHSCVTFIPKRHRAYWGDISIVDAMFSLLRCAMKEKNYKKFVFLSGEDYPIQDSNAIYNTLLQEQEYIIGTKLSHSYRVEAYSFCKLSSRFAVRLIRRVLYTLGFRKRPYIKVGNEKWDVYLSSQWTALSRECVEYVLSIVDTYPQIRKYFKYSLAPDELIIPTVIYNSSKWRHKTLADLEKQYEFDEMGAIHYQRHWSYDRPCDSSVEILDEYAYERIISSGKLFLRKVRKGKSDKLMDMLDAYRVSDCS